MANPSEFKPLLKGLTMLALFGGLIFLARSLGLEGHLTDRQWLLGQVQGHGAAGVLFFLGVTALSTALGVPRQLTALLGGYAFGWFWGTLLATLGTALGCATDFTVARYLGRDFVLARFARRAAKLDAFLRTGPFRTSLAIRLLPVGHNLLTSVAAGVTSIPALPFILGSAVGYMPQNLVFAIFGGGVGAESGPGRMLSIGVSVALLAASAWLGVSVYRAYKRQGLDLEEAEGE
ncbi:MAG: VTT domain-containing protein [Proteobacteria bacterium]|nr:VTT domain-containing protein [Pseudomonadota bacterium]MBU1593944.1 VTT domain-containing protein [Pseudomonadota bacterium]